MSTQKLFWLVLGSQGKAGKIFEDPLVFQSIVDDFDQLSCQSDNIMTYTARIEVLRFRHMDGSAPSAFIAPRRSLKPQTL